MLAVKYSGRVEYFFHKLNQRKAIAKNRALYRVSGLVMSNAKRMIRVSPRPAQPGKPVHSRTRGGLRTIRFSVSTSETSSIIGSMKFYGSNKWDEPQPHIHEFGGWFQNRRHYYANYPKRSYVAAALEKLKKEGIIPRQFGITMANII